MNNIPFWNPFQNRYLFKSHIISFFKKFILFLLISISYQILYDIILPPDEDEEDFDDEDEEGGMKKSPHSLVWT